MLATGDGVQGDGVLEGNEESLTTYSDSVFVNQLRHAHTGGYMSEQRVLFNMRSEEPRFPLRLVGGSYGHCIC